MIPTWRELWARVRAVWRAYRLKPRYCGDCGVPLTADETITCAECIEHRMTERAAHLTPVELALQRQYAALLQNVSGRYGQVTGLGAMSAEAYALIAQRQLAPPGVTGGIFGALSGILGGSHLGWH